MHILSTTSATLDDLAEPVDLGQAPAEMVVASFSDSDLGALAAAYEATAGREAPRDGAALPRLRLAQLRELKHPMSVDLWVDRLAPHARIVVLRLLGGLDWWRYGVERLAQAARAHGFALAVLPGEDRDDPRLDSYSTLPADDLAALLAAFRAGGPANMRSLLARLCGHAGTPRPVPAVIEMPLAGFYPWGAGEAVGAPDPSPHPSPRRGQGAGGAAGDVPFSADTSPARRPVVPVLFYRSMALAGDAAPVEALCAALASRGLDPRPIFVASLKEPASLAYLRAELPRLAPAALVTLTAFAAGEPGEAGVFDLTDAPVFQAVAATTRRPAWREGARGLVAADLAMHIVLPELDGRVLAGAISFKDAVEHAATGFTHQVNRPEPDLIALLADKVAASVRLRALAPAARRVALVMPDYAGAAGRSGWAVGLDVPASLRAALHDLAAVGYSVADIPADERALVAALAGPGEAALPLADYRARLARMPAEAVAAMEQVWGPPEDDPDLRDGAFQFRARRCGALWLAVAPERGSRAERRAQYHDATLPPRHGLLAFGLWLQEAVDALVHMGAHGTLEWLPGKQVALTPGCFPQLVVGALPVAYPFIVSNPGEAAQAKRRLAAVTLGHLPPPMKDAELDGAARDLERLVDEYAQAEGLDRRRRERLAGLIVDQARASGLAGAARIEAVAADEALRRIDAFLCDLKELRLKDGFHVYGRGSCGAAERDGLLAALAGRRVAAGPAGVPGRGRTDVLPTGRNLFTADPRGLPTPTAMDLGRLAAEEVVTAYLQAHGDWPRALVLDLWGSATLRTGGEEIAQGLVLIGARPVWDPASGRVTGVEVLPPAMLGRPRIDVTFRISGLFRDLFPAQIALLDAALRAVARRDEPAEENPLAAAGEGALRIFGTAPGAYGAGLDSASGDDRAAAGAAYLAAASHAYGGPEGTARPAGEAFAARVAAADLLVHGQDDPGRDLLEGDADLAFLGGLSAAAALMGASPDLVVLDTTDPARPKARPLEQALERLVRRRVAPAYLAGLMRHGPRGAAELVETVDRLVGFAELTDAVPSHLIDLVHAAYVADPALRDFLAAQSPEGAREIARRLGQARARGLWHPRRNDVCVDLATLLGEAAE